MKISEIIKDKYKLRISPTVYYDLLADVQEAEEEPCEDAISRQSTIEAFQMFRGYESNRTNAEWVDRIETVVRALPPVTPQEPCEDFKQKAGVVISQLRADRYRLATALEEIERTITEHAYPVRSDTNSIELGMTLTGIKQAFDMHRKVEE